MRSSSKQNVLSALGFGTPNRAPPYGKSKLSALYQSLSMLQGWQAARQRSICNFKTSGQTGSLNWLSSLGALLCLPTCSSKFYLPSTDTASCSFLQCYCFWTPGLVCILLLWEMWKSALKPYLKSLSLYLKSQVLLNLGICVKSKGLFIESEAGIQCSTP